MVGELPSQFAERAGTEYASDSVHAEKRNKGQFFTPLVIASFMSGLATPACKDEITVLDPGCGCGILSCALIEHLCKQDHRIKRIRLVGYEIDELVIPFTSSTFDYLKAWLKERSIKLDCSVIRENFVLANSYCLQEMSLFGDNPLKFDYIISNPPYFKLSKEDPQSLACSCIVDGQANIYALFMAICSRMLTDEGQMVFITPRSFASGRYFHSFRDFLFDNVKLNFVHLFNNRKETFAKDDVLQELVITKMGKKDTSHIIVSTSNGISDITEARQKEYIADEVVDIHSKEKIIYLAQDDRDERILSLFRSWDGNMNKYGINISTGPVVAFRLYDSITEDEAKDSVPLFWLHNVVKMLADHPVVKDTKGQYIRITPLSIPYLLPNKNYIFLRRMSSKDDSSRLIAAPYFGNASTYKYVGVENKLNYIYKVKGHLKREETVGLSALLNSDLFDSYFRTFNGNINVSATELRSMPLPPIETIRQIGGEIILRNDFSVNYINTIMSNYFNV